ncbi:MAG: hypothetical protein M1829_004298 [Trizodia sp. TS-e1964]|nr:MAG: hypothetical protein M1829_004298 [Trizodia sp. TS-e1964]
MAPPPPTSTNDEAHQRLLEKLDIGMLRKPFRNPRWKPAQRRNKNIKTIISEISRREASLLATQNNSGVSTPNAPGSSTTNGGASTPALASSGLYANTNIAQAAQKISRLVLERNAQVAFPVGPVPTYTNIESAPSLSVSNRKHYCDITGLPASYVDPKTRLRYHNKEIFAVVRSLGPGIAESYLEARGAHTILK